MKYARLARRTLLMCCIYMGLSWQVGASSSEGVMDFELIDGLIFVEASVDGESGQFILDTGTSGLVLNDARADGKPLNVEGIYQSVKAVEVQVRKFQWGHIVKRDMVAWALDLNYLEEAFDRPLRGILGIDVFADHVVTLDYALNRIRLGPRQVDSGQKQILPLKRTSDGHLILRIAIQDEMHNFLIDTGAGITMIDQKRRNTITDAFVKTENSTHVYTLETGMNQRIHLLHSMRIGQIEVRDMSFVFGDLSGVLDDMDGDITGILSISSLNLSQVQFDLQHETCAIYP